MYGESTPSDSVRIPDPRRGVAIHVRRYNTDRAVIIHPEDFERFELLDSVLSEVAKLEPLPASEIADAAYIAEATPGEALTDPDELRRLFS